jgi:hypothetical protein
MNRAQKRTWLKFTVSVAGLLVMGGVLAVTNIYDLDMADSEDHTALRLLGLLCAIPLILVVIVDRSWKKIYDERDLDIERRALIFGVIGTFCFLGGAGWFLSVMTRMGSIRALLIIALAYSAYFVLLLVSSLAALIQYGRSDKGEKS